MNRYLLAFALFLLLRGLTFAQPTGDFPPPNIPRKAPNSLLWEISGNGLEQVGYLYGTIHVIPKDSFFITERVAACLDQAARLVLEVDFEEPENTFSYEFMLLPKQRTLQKTLATDDFASLKSFLVDSLPHSSPLKLEDIERQKPIFVSERLSSARCADIRSRDLRETTGYETYLTRYFRRFKRPIEGLETTEEQFASLDLMTFDEQVSMLRHTLQNSGSMCMTFDELVAAYRRQDLTRLDAMIDSESNGAAYRNAMLDNRNLNWIPRIEKFLRAGQPFIAVGAAHLLGERGLIELLRAKGYTVRPLW